MIKKRKIEFDQLYWTFDYFNRLILHFYLPKKREEKTKQNKKQQPKSNPKNCILHHNLWESRGKIKLYIVVC